MEFFSSRADSRVPILNRMSRHVPPFFFAIRLRAAVAFLLITRAAVATVPLQLAGPFSDHMVLQRGIPITVWGAAEPGAMVRVRLGKREIMGKASSDGTWRLLLPPPEEDLMRRPGDLLVTCGNQHQAIRDVVSGDVWLCSGQSNMRYQLGRHEVRVGSKDDPASPMIFAKEVAGAGDPMLRLLNVSSGNASTPADRRWARCTPETVKGFSAIGYFFGRSLRRDGKTPIGLIDLGKGGASIRAFLPPQLIAADPRLGPLRDNDQKHENGSVYTRDIRWLAPLALRGVLWYQGESDITRAPAYPGMLSSMVERWRADFGNPGLPFLIVELPAYGGKAGQPQDQRLQSEWRPLLCEAQERFVTEMPETYLTVASDLGEEHEIHPRWKEPLGERLALLAREKVYGEKVSSSPPVLESTSLEKGAMLLRFHSAGGSLKVREGSPAGRLQDFVAAGNDGDYKPAVAEIVSPDTVRVSFEAPEGGGTVTRVRYGWTGYFVPSLFNAAGIPAGPFRTDKDTPAKTPANPPDATSQPNSTES